MRPRIGITKPLKGGALQNIANKISIFLCGGWPVNITVNKPRFDERIDGVLLSGGSDMHPDLYNLEEFKDGYFYDQRRDEMELKWIEKAKKEKLPLFGICRGAQLMNVQAGGSLFFDINKAFEDADYPSHLLAKIFFRKKMIILKNTILHKAIPQESSRVNSLHSQSIDKLGEDFKISAKEPNGIVQGIESTTIPFQIGVQFHPEFLLYRKNIRRLFKMFIDACKKKPR